MNPLALVIILFLSKGFLAMRFDPGAFTDLSEECRRNGGRKAIRKILDEDNAAAYLRVDPGSTVKRKHTFTTSGTLQEIHRLIDSEEFRRHAGKASNATFDCVIQIETALPARDKDAESSDALSLIILELNHFKKGSVKISTFGDQVRGQVTITEPAHYTDKVWASANPNFLLSGQLSGFDSIDYRSRINTQHIVKPEQLRSSWDQPASITVNLTDWSRISHVYMIFTSYKYLKKGRCHADKEFDCSAPMGFLGSSKRVCMKALLACDGLPNCGQDFLPNQDENCLNLHWSSVLLSLVSYILLAITLLLCLSCFARVLIQWSVRSSLAELRGVNSPGGSFRSSSRFFSFLGTTFASRWDRPPPTYDEAMKHVNPDISRPADPPAYADTLGRSNLSRSSSSVAQTPPPEYRSCETLNNRRESDGRRYPPLDISEEEELTLTTRADVNLEPMLETI